MYFLRFSQFHTLFFAISLLLLSGCGINNIPTYHEAAEAAFSQVLNQYQRRADLIPNLVVAVAGYTNHEKETLEAVIKARAQIMNLPLTDKLIKDQDALQQFEKDQEQLRSALSRLLVVVERYPSLKASINFLSFQNQLEGTENRIAIAIRDYILAVQKYNTELKIFPGRIWAFILYQNSKPMANFRVPESATKVPEVKF